MKKWAAIITVVFSVGGGRGYLAAAQTLKSDTMMTETQAALQLRTEGVQPACAQFDADTQPTVVQKGTDYFLTLKRKNYYYVIGINLPVNHPPVFAWWGAELGSARQDCRI